MKPLLRNRCHLVSVALVASLSATTRALGQCPSTEGEAVVNGRIVSTVAVRDPVDLLLRHLGSNRVVVGARTSGFDPLIVVDGVLLSGGVERLFDVRIGDLASITVLQRLVATTRYGTRGSYGAIVVETKGGHVPLDSSVRRYGCSRKERAP
jgi:hypothetical protein